MKTLISFLFFIAFFSSPRNAIGQNIGLEWVRQSAGLSSENSFSLSIDGMGNVYNTGWFTDTVNFNYSGSHQVKLASYGHGDIYVQKLDSEGELLWVRQMGGTGRDLGHCVTTDKEGNVYTTGWFVDTVDFDPGIDTLELVSVGEQDAFLQKMDSNGRLLWVNQFGGASATAGLSVVIDDQNSIYLTGYFNETVDFDPGLGAVNLSSHGVGDAFILKLDSEGNFLWVRQLGGVHFDRGASIDVDGNGGVYVAGHFADTINVDLVSDTVSLITNGSWDIYVLKLNSEGDFLWIKQMGGEDLDEGQAIEVDNEGNVYTTGYFQELIDLDPGVGVSPLISNGGRDAFIQKLDSLGNFVWANQLGGDSDDYGRGVHVDSLMNVFLSGEFQETVDFDPGPRRRELSSNGGWDVFIQKLSSDGDLIWAETQGGTGWDSGKAIINDSQGNIYLSGWFSNIVDFDPGVNVRNIQTRGNFDIYVQKFNQCPPSYEVDVQIACDSFTWIDGITYFSSNSSPTLTLINSQGCDSIISLELTINRVSDLTATINGSSIIANNSNATYQWLDCDNEYTPILGETEEIFTAVSNGSYAVELTENGCVDTSDCFLIDLVEVNEQDSWNNRCSVFPNPSNGLVTIKFEKEWRELKMKIYDIQGILLESSLYQNSREISIQLDYPAGIYIVDMVSEAGTHNTKIVLK